MKFSLNTKSLLAALATLKSVARPSTTHPIIGNVWIDARKNSISILGMDLEKQLTIELPATVKKAGATTISCIKLHDSLAKARGVECIIEVSPAHEAIIRVGSAITKLRGLDPDGMPPQIAQTAEFTTVQIPAQLLANALTKSLVFASRDTTKPILCSIKVVAQNGKLSFQATDFKHAIICSTDIDFDSKGQFIIPRESIPSIANLATDGDVTLGFCDDSMFAKTETANFATKLLEGTIPDFGSVFDVSRPTKIIANREELIATIEYARVQTTEQADFVILACDGSTITATGAGGVISKEPGMFTNMNEDTMPCGKGSDAITIKANPVFALDTLKATSGDEVTLLIDERQTSFLIRENEVVCSVSLMRI